MLMWIDGTYGVGKTSVAKEIKRVVEKNEVIVLDSDYYYQELGKKNPYAIIYGGAKPQNNIYFLNYFKEVIQSNLSEDRLIIVVMSATMYECKTILVEYFESLIGFTHIILTADKSEVISRINMDNKSSRDRNFAIENIENNCDFLDKYYANVIRINTNEKSISCVATEIIKKCL